jgi:hypothetical protein
MRGFKTFAFALLTIVLSLAVWQLWTADHPIKLLKTAALCFLALAACIALVFAFFGESLANALPEVRRFREIQRLWAPIPISGYKIPRNCELDSLLNRRIEEVCDANLEPAVFNTVRQLRFGSVATIVFYRGRALRHLTRELRFYCTAYVILFVGSIMFGSPELAGKSVTELADVVLSQHFIPMLEVSTILFLLFRFFSEISQLRMMDPKEGE